MLSDKYGEITMSSDSNIVFKTRGLSKVYDMGEVKVHALRGVDLDLYEGELVVLLGASGSGKSTLVNILGGLDTASSGSVLYQDKDLTRATDRELTKYRRHYVGFVFQFYNLIPSLTAAENIAIVTEIAQNPIEPQEALELVGLATVPTASRLSYPAGSSREWPSRGQSPNNQLFCCVMNPPVHSIPKPASSFWKPCRG